MAVRIGREPLQHHILQHITEQDKSSEMTITQVSQVVALKGRHILAQSVSPVYEEVI